MMLTCFSILASGRASVLALMVLQRGMAEMNPLTRGLLSTHNRAGLESYPNLKYALW